MTSVYVSHIDIDEYIKLFLNSVHEFDDIPNPDTTKRVILDASNYLSLLNLPDQIMRHGPLHLYWEGNRERYIQVLKPLPEKHAVPCQATQRTRHEYLATADTQCQTINECCRHR
mmetsp:Transcript_32498/g.70382  ORF Transcript_32498/g.70382 Transcript_32498/m.70382 type:complete len:115 (+) Transcript_32498:2-346(+)